eukprot:TCALIF_06856-PA protein Name:"Similar to TIMELESS Protein timeless homolog (Homo sapiens)" AED:0.06 eAED:0.06 QI:44/0.83/0.71/0.85/0.83/0.71/7/0/1087
MEWVADLEATCSNLGTWDGNKYVKDPDCSECVKDLIRFLRRDDENHEIRRRLGQIQVVQSDLIPLMRDYAQESDLFELVLRLLVNLTNPEILLFREELPEDKLTRHYYLQLQRIRQDYKRAFVDELLWQRNQERMMKILEMDPADRSEDDQFTIERILILLRNMLQVPSNAASEQRMDDDISIHDQVLWVLHKSGMAELLLFMASSSQESQFCLHVVEIISLMLREQDPGHLASANVARSEEEKSRDERLLMEARERELELERQKKKSFVPARHSRFGGTFVVSNISSISDGKHMLCHKPLRDLDNLDFDKEKRPLKVARNKVTPTEKIVTRRSTLSIRLFLKEFCIDFIHGAYNVMMRTVKDYLNRQRAQQNDESYYLWAMRFFMEFNRKYEFHVDFVSETLSKSTFHYIQQQIELYKDNFEHEKRNRPVCLLWSRRMHLALKAYAELLSTIVTMQNNGKNDDILRHSARVLLANVFYEPEYREVCLTLFSIFKSDKMTKSFLKDLVEANHVFLKLLEHMSKTNSLVIGKRLKKRRGGKKSKKGGKPLGGNFSEARATNEEYWDKVSPGLTEYLQGEGGELPTGISPFDATLELEEDKRKAVSLYRIQKALQGQKAGLALALLRASREVWPDGDEVFGAEDIDAEEEFILLREILFSEMDTPDPAHLPSDEFDSAENGTNPKSNTDNEFAKEGLAGKDADPNEEEGEENDQEEDEEEEEVAVETYIGEQKFDLKGFVLRYANAQICTCYAQLFREYRTNSDSTNHAIIKMFHRIAFDCDLPALLFHVSVFRVFQRIHEEYNLGSGKSKSLTEMHKFAEFLLKKFFDVVVKNPKCFIELFFWISPKDAADVMDGYQFVTLDMSGKSKKSFWSEEDEETLTRTFEQLKEMQEKGQDKGSILDGLLAFLEPRGKTKRQIVRKLKELHLIQNAKELHNKKIHRKSSKSGQRNKQFKSRDAIEGSDSSDDEKDKENPASPVHVDGKRPALFSDNDDDNDSSSSSSSDEENGESGVGLISVPESSIIELPSARSHDLEERSQEKSMNIPRPQPIPEDLHQNPTHSVNSCPSKLKFWERTQGWFGRAAVLADT